MLVLKTFYVNDFSNKVFLFNLYPSCTQIKMSKLTSFVLLSVSPNCRFQLFKFCWKTTKYVTFFSVLISFWELVRLSVNF